MAGGATRRTTHAASGPGREATTRKGVRSIPCLQMVFSTKATYWRPPGATATAGSPQAQVDGVSDGTSPDLQVRPPSLESYDLTCGRTESFDAAQNLRGSSGATATAISVCAPGARESDCTSAPAAAQGLCTWWTLKW